MKLREYNPEVYPIRLWICTDPNPEELADELVMFEMDDTLPSPKRNIEMFEDLMPYSSSNCCKVVNDDGVRGCLLVFSETKDYVFVHECSHFVDWCDEYLGLESHDFEHGEARAYLTEWAFNCCNKFIKDG